MLALTIRYCKQRYVSKQSVFSMMCPANIFSLDLAFVPKMLLTYIVGLQKEVEI
jgi:hypothetical protein